MRSLSMLVMFSVGMLFSGVSVVQAHNDTFFNSPHELELKPSSLLSGEGVKLAKSYWLGGADIGLTFKGDDGSTICRAMGYTTAGCTPPLSISKTCSYDKSYHMCGCDSAIYKYNDENCPYGSVPNADVCDGFSRGCDCEERGYVWDDTTGLCIFSCTSDSDCLNGEVCDTSDGQCYECLQPSDCGEGYECIDHQCKEVDLCENSNCTGGQQCNPDTGECECPSGTELLDGQCQEANCLNGGKECRDSTPVCDSSGCCVQCTSSDQSYCGADQKCNLSKNICEKINRCDGVNCSGGKDCNPDNGLCECPSGTIEVDGVCETPNCSNGGDSCSGSTPHCTDDGRCVECTQNSHCNTSRGEICASDHTCQTTDLCWDAEDRCPVGSTCNSSSGACSCPGDLTDINNVCDCASGYKKNTSCVDCTQDSHCGDANQWACQNNSCVNLCANVSCTNGTCVRGKCQCNTGFVETANGCEAPNCTNGGVKCTGNTDVCNQATGKCVECTQDSHCSGGRECVNNSCQCPSNKSHVSPDGQCVECTAGNHCPTGKCDYTTYTCDDTENCLPGSIFYADKTCSETYKPDKVIVGVVVDPKAHMVVNLTNKTGPIVHGTNGFKNVGNEEENNFSERGYDNTREIYEQIKDIDKTTIITSCWETTSNALVGGRMYVPATAEASLISQNLTEINETLTMLSQYTRADTIGSEIWTSDESLSAAPVGMIVYSFSSDKAFGGLVKYTPTIDGRCIGRYEKDPFWGDIIYPSVDGMGNSYMTYPLTDSCRGSYFRDVFYWNTDYNRCVYDYELEAGGGEEPGPSLPSCEEWEENGWLNASTSYNSSVCRSYDESIQECQYKDGSKGKFCDLSTNCTFGAEAYRTYKYCPNGARCMYNSCQYYQNISASESPRRLGRNKNCYTCIQSTNESCGTRQNFVQCK